MNTSRSSRLPRTSRALIVILLTVLGLIGGSLHGVSAQSAPTPGVAHFMLGAVERGTLFAMAHAGTVFHTPEGDFTGYAGPAQLGEALAGSLSNVDLAPVSSVAYGDGMVVVSFTLTGINTGSYRGMDANCAGVAVPGVAVLRLTEQVLSSESWTATPVEQRSDLPVAVTIETIAEAWITYDRDLIASQIAAFNAIVDSGRPGCTSQSIQLPDVSYVPAATCPAPAICAIP